MIQSHDTTSVSPQTLSERIEAIKREYTVTDLQVCHCSLHQHENGRYFYRVLGAHFDAFYTVEYSQQLHKLTCTCMAGQNGRSCWHERASIAHFKIEQLRLHERRLHEQLEDRVEHALYAVESAQANLDREQARQEQEASNREHAAVARDGYKAYERKPFSLLR